MYWIGDPLASLSLDDNSEFKFNTPAEEASLEEIEEEKYYGYDSELSYDEETKDYDQLADHHVHGKGFDAPVVVVEEEVPGEWADIDWKKAIVSAEILRRPEYWFCYMKHLLNTLKYLLLRLCKFYN